ncbi:hypothetical protein [Saccharospirillum alexandrii]|uniref:hypothetical protein n=1 Tax=Saccharospirillum alexandrii TaxID=2448477 RepID=UPI00373611DA
MTTDDGFATWQVTLTLQPGENQLVVRTRDAAGHTNAQADMTTVQVIPVPLSQPAEDGILIDDANFRALVPIAM